jgi:sugar phosphate isomerase/epimerase
MGLASVSRRAFLAAPAALAAPPGFTIAVMRRRATHRGAPRLAAPPGFKIAVMEGAIGFSGNPEAVVYARKLGFDGLQVTLSQLTPASVAAFREASRKHQIPIVATYLDILHKHCLKSDPRAIDDVRRAIETTRELGAPICMTVFFGQCAVQNRDEESAVARAFQPLAAEAARAGVILGFENVLTAEGSLRVLKQVKSPALQVYYDIGNATNLVGVEPAGEIRKLGHKNLCQVHVKDKGYLGEGKVDIRAALVALRKIGYSGYLVLETSSPSGNPSADLSRNLAYLKNLIREIR